VTNKKQGFFSDGKKHKRRISAPLEKVGPLVVAITRPGPAVLTAITFKGGQCLVTSGSTVELAALIEAVADPAAAKAENAALEKATAEKAAAAKTAAEKAEAEQKEAEAKAKASAALAKSEPKAAATVRRPTPSCPQCQVGAIQPASEVLLSFLNEEEHESWSRGRFLIVEGGLSGHRYLLAHRHSTLAAKIGRVCFDLDARCVVHFHDWRVPPEEEILAAKLILEHREPWLRNEATMFQRTDNAIVFKNPFGDIGDGLEDAAFTRQLTVEMLQDVAVRAFRATKEKFLQGVGLP